MASPARAMEPEEIREKSRRVMGLEQPVFFTLLLQLLALAFAFGILYQKVEDLKEDVSTIKRVLIPEKPSPARVARE